MDDTLLLLFCAVDKFCKEFTLNGKNIYFTRDLNTMGLKTTGNEILIVGHEESPDTKMCRIFKNIEIKNKISS